MSYKSYVSAMEKASECDGYDTGTGVSGETVGNAEKLLDIIFSKQLREYLLNYGFLEFFGVELYGIIKEDFSSTVLEGNIVEWTLNERKNNDLDPKWLPIRFEDDGAMAFMDFSRLNSEGEPAVILAVNTEKGYEFQDELADDLGEYILELVNWQLEDQ